MDLSKKIRSVMLIGVLAIIAPVYRTIAQQPVQVVLKSLTVGDTLHPGIPLKMMNYNTGQAKIKDFQGKVLLLDFWEKYCQACINGLPKLQRLQDRFAGKLNVIVVTSDNEGGVRSLLDRVEFLKDVSLPFAVEDSLLKDVFPHRIIPHIVWLDSSGIVKAITGAEEVTAANVQALIEGRELNLPLKKEPIARAGSTTDDDTSGDSLLLIRSELRRASIMSGRGHIGIDTENNLPNSIYFRMTPIGMLYNMFSYTKLGLLGNVNIKRVIVKVNDSLIYKRYTNATLQPLPFYPRKFPYLHYNTRDEYHKENILEYTLTLPHGVPDTLLLQYGLADLNQYLPIKGRVEKRRMPCWVVTATDSAAALLASGGGKPRSIYNNESVGVINKPIERFFYWLKQFRDAEPFFNETGIDIPVDLVVDFHDSPIRNPKSGYIGNNPLDRDMLKAALQRYGLIMKKEEREVDMLVIYD